jgi:hypothetical protein
MNITWKSFLIGKDDLYTALNNTTPNNLYNQLDYNTIIPKEYIDLAHEYYFGYNLPVEDEFNNLLSMIPYSDYLPITENTNAKAEYYRLYQNKFTETNPDLRKIINEQKQLSEFRSPLLRSTATKFLLSLNPNVDLSKLNNPFNDKIKEGLYDIRAIINEQREYLKYETDCTKIFVVVYLNKIPAGGVVIFYNPNYLDDHGSRYIYIQGIAKYPVIYLIETLYPEYTKNIPKLNTILDSIIKEIGINLGAEYVYVNPVGRQGEFLEKYYNYEINKNPPVRSCNSIIKPLDESQNYFKKIS